MRNIWVLSASPSAVVMLNVKDHEQKVQKGLQKPKGKETYLDADPFPHVTSRKLSEQTKRWLSQ